MDLAEFILKVAEMRTEQKNYFRYRTPDHLKAAKKLEEEIDREIEIFTGKSQNSKKTENAHPTLF